MLYNFNNTIYLIDNKHQFFLSEGTKSIKQKLEFGSEYLFSNLGNDKLGIPCLALLLVSELRTSNE